MQHNLPTHLLVLTIALFLAPIGCGGDTEDPGVPPASVGGGGDNEVAPETGGEFVPATINQEPQTGVSPATAAPKEPAAPEVAIKTNQTLHP